MSPPSPSPIVVDTDVVSYLFKPDAWALLYCRHLCRRAIRAPCIRHRAPLVESGVRIRVADLLPPTP